MSRMNELFMKKIQTGSLDETGDEDYLYEEYLKEESLKKDFWEYASENDLDVIPTPDEEQENFEQIKKQNGL